ncbi:MAG TPA: hypothetical protein VFI23_14215 [Rhizomicrobium sp.]|nr:hypothetical protein [Rhizomicrobium sp.]
MRAPEQRQDYVAKAEEAEKLAARCKDTILRNAWLRIAGGYRDLANLVGARNLSWEYAAPASKYSRLN